MMPSRLSPLAVYCGASRGARPSYAAAARELGLEMVAHGVDLVYGGGRVGLMGDVADAVLSAGGSVVGVITHELVRREVAHDGVADMRVVETMHERKKVMADLARGYVALPGGVGTCDELFEIMAWSQLAIHDFPIGLLNTEGYYDKLIEFLDHAAAESFLQTDPREMLIVDADPSRLLGRMSTSGPLVRRELGR